MTTTDTDALTERIARALFEVRDDPYDLDKWEDLDSTDRERWMCDAAAVLPIVAVEVRKAKAEAWAEGWDHRNTPDGYAWDGEQDVPLVSSRYDNPYCETGDSDEHR